MTNSDASDAYELSDWMASCVTSGDRCGIEI